MAKPNLAYIPATIGDKVYSILPNDSVGDFDFDRADGSSPTGVTRINAQGLIETVASGENRLNYSLLDGEVVGCPHLLLEPARTNLVQYSEDFSNGYWIKTRTTVSANNIISPDGTLNADKIIETTDTGLHAVSETFTVVSGVSHTVSVFIKKGTNEFVQILFGTNDVTNNPYVNFDVNQGVFENNGTTSVDVKYFGNGWYRCSSTVTTASTSLTYFISSIQSISDSRASSFSGNVNNNIYLYGAMLEEGSYPTSYIKTNSGSATTRAAETCNNSGNAATFNDSEGVLMAEIAALVDDQTRRHISVSDGSTENVVRFHYNDNASNSIRFQIRSNNSIEASVSFSVNDIKEFHKVAIHYKLNDVKFFIDGFYVGTDTNATMPIGLSVLQFNQGNGGAKFLGKTKQIQYFDSVLADTQLEELTSWDSFRAMAEGQLYTIE